MPIDVLVSPTPVVIAPGERVMGIVFLTLICAGIAFVTICNAVARRHWIAWHVKWFLLRFIPFFFVFLVIMRVMMMVGFRGWWVRWVQYLAMVISSPLLRPVPTFERPRKIPKHIRRAVIQAHVKRTGSFDPKAEEIDHMVAFSKGGGHTKDNLWVVTKNFNWVSLSLTRPQGVVVYMIRYRTEESLSMRDLSPLSDIPMDHLLVAFKAYFDGGNQADTRLYDTITLAAVSATSSLWGAFEKDWAVILEKHGAKFLHTTDAIAGQGPYAQWGRSQVNEFVGDCVSVIEKHATTRADDQFVYKGLRPAAVTVFLKDFKKASAEVPGLGAVEELCMIHATAGCTAWGINMGCLKVHFYFDQNERFYGHLLDRLRNKKARAARPELENHVVHHGVSDMRSVPGLQAADLFAWSINHMYKYGIKPGWHERLLAIDRDEESFDYERLIQPNMKNLETVRSWGLPPRSKPR